MPTENERLREKIASLEGQIAVLRKMAGRGVRARSRGTLWGLPWYDIAMGPDPEKGQRRGHARGVVAIGDLATGILAVGGIARGIIAMGGVAIGLFATGGLSVGILLAIGGLAVGTVALGGCAVGLVAVGGAALGVVAIGGDAIGKYVLSATEQSRELVDFLAPWFPDLRP